MTNGCFQADLYWGRCSMQPSSAAVPQTTAVSAQMVFSSSCTVYGQPVYTPLDEKHRLQVCALCL